MWIWKLLIDNGSKIDLDNDRILRPVYRSNIMQEYKNDIVTLLINKWLNINNDLQEVKTSLM